MPPHADVLFCGTWSRDAPMLAHRLSALQRTLKPSVAASRLLVFAADHGVTATHPRVSAYPRKVSIAVFRAIATGGAAR